LLDIDNNFDQTSTLKSLTHCINHEQKKNLQSILRKSKSDETKQISFDTQTLRSEEKNNKNNTKRTFEDLKSESNKYTFGYVRPVDITEQEYKKALENEQKEEEDSSTLLSFTTTTDSFCSSSFSSFDNASVHTIDLYEHLPISNDSSQLKNVRFSFSEKVENSEELLKQNQKKKQKSKNKMKNKSKSSTKSSKTLLNDKKAIEKFDSTPTAHNLTITNQKTKGKANKKVDFIDMKILKTSISKTNDAIRADENVNIPIEIETISFGKKSRSNCDSFQSASFQCSPKSADSTVIVEDSLQKSLPNKTSTTKTTELRDEDSSFIESNLSSSSSEAVNKQSIIIEKLNCNVGDLKSTHHKGTSNKSSSTSSGVSSNISSASSTTSETPSADHASNSIGLASSSSSLVQNQMTNKPSMKIAPKAIIADDGDIEIEKPYSSNMTNSNSNNKVLYEHVKQRHSTKNAHQQHYSRTAASILMGDKNYRSSMRLPSDSSSQRAKAERCSQRLTGNKSQYLQQYYQSIQQSQLKHPQFEQNKLEAAAAAVAAVSYYFEIF